MDVDADAWPAAASCGFSLLSPVPATAACGLVLASAIGCSFA